MGRVGVAFSSSFFHAFISSIDDGPILRRSNCFLDRMFCRHHHDLYAGLDLCVRWDFWHSAIPLSQPVVCGFIPWHVNHDFSLESRHV